MKIYKEFKEIEIKDIKGGRYNRICNRYLEKVCRYIETIKSNGIKKPFEIIQKENGYYILNDKIKLVAAKAVGYDKVPCLIRNIEQEILLRKVNKILKLENENHKIKDHINDKKDSNFCKNNYYKLNIL